MELQLKRLKKDVDILQKKYGHHGLSAIYGAGRIYKPTVLFLFMNPTARNVSAFSDWRGIRAPWIGTKNVWKIFNKIGLMDTKIYKLIKESGQGEWSENFAQDVYENINNKSVYITNLAKCTQKDARKLNDAVFKKYLKNTLKEIYFINPQKIISFGNQVSSILLNRKIKVSEYKDKGKEVLFIKDKKLDVYPVYYPVGQGARNMNKAIKRIKCILSH